VIGVDDGIWAGNLDAADVLFLIAAVVFAIAAILPHVRRVPTVDGSRTHIDFGVSLVPAGLCLVAIAWLVL
jgi:hypothetical protein